MGDNGTPFVISLPDSLEIVQTYSKLAETVKEQLIELRTEPETQVDYDPKTAKIKVNFSDGECKEFDPYHLRINCKCAACVSEVDGRQILKVETVPKDVYPTNMIKKGNYAVAVVWSDGHRSSIYPYERLKNEL